MENKQGNSQISFINLTQQNKPGANGSMWDMYQVALTDGTTGFTFTRAGNPMSKKVNDMVQYEATWDQRSNAYRVKFINPAPAAGAPGSYKKSSGGYSGTPPEVSALAQAVNLIGNLPDNIKAMFSGQDLASTMKNYALYTTTLAGKFKEFLAPSGQTQQQPIQQPVQQQPFGQPIQVPMQQPGQQQSQPPMTSASLADDLPF